MLEGREQVNGPVPRKLELSDPPSLDEKRNDARVTRQIEASSGRQRIVL